jgi:hypothetical protein
MTPPRWWQCPDCGARVSRETMQAFGWRHTCREDVVTRFKEKKAKRTRTTGDKFKAAVIERSGGRCEWTDEDGRCFAHASQAHHVLPRSRGGTDDPDNGVGLCMRHHYEVHAYPDQAKAKGLLR